MPYRIARPGHDDFVYSEPPPRPRERDAAGDDDELAQAARRGRTLRGHGHSSDEAEERPAALYERLAARRH